MANGDILAVRIASATRDNGWVAAVAVGGPASKRLELSIGIGL